LASCPALFPNGLAVSVFYPKLAHAPPNSACFEKEENGVIPIHSPLSSAPVELQVYILW
jgi:hypothetical protein